MSLSQPRLSLKSTLSSITSTTQTDPLNGVESPYLKRKEDNRRSMTNGTQTYESISSGNSSNSNKGKGKGVVGKLMKEKEIKETVYSTSISMIPLKCFSPNNKREGKEEKIEKEEKENSKESSKEKEREIKEKDKSGRLSPLSLVLNELEYKKKNDKKDNIEQLLHDLNIQITEFDLLQISINDEKLLLNKKYPTIKEKIHIDLEKASDLESTIYSLIFNNKPYTIEASSLLSLRLDIYTSSSYISHNSADTLYYRILLAETYYLNNMHLQFISHAVSIIENIERVSLDMKRKITKNYVSININKSLDEDKECGIIDDDEDLIIDTDEDMHETISWEKILDTKSNILIILYLYLAKSYSKLGRNEDAISFCNKALENEKSSSFVHMQCLWVHSDILYESGNFNECKETIEDIWRILDSNKNINEQATSISQSPNDYNAAQFLPVYFALGKLHLKLGMYKRAIGLFEQIFKLYEREIKSPLCSDAYYLSAQCHAALNEKNLEFKCLLKCLDMHSDSFDYSNVSFFRNTSIFLDKLNHYFPASKSYLVGDFININLLTSCLSDLKIHQAIVSSNIANFSIQDAIGYCCNLIDSMQIELKSNTDANIIAKANSNHDLDRNIGLENREEYNDILKQAQLNSLYGISASSNYINELNKLQNNLSFKEKCIPNQNTHKDPYNYFSSNDFVHPLKFAPLPNALAPKSSTDILPDELILPSIEDSNFQIVTWKYNELYVGLWILLAECLVASGHKVHSIAIYKHISSLLFAALLDGNNYLIKHIEKFRHLSKDDTKIDKFKSPNTFRRSVEGLQLDSLQLSTSVMGTVKNYVPKATGMLTSTSAFVYKRPASASAVVSPSPATALKPTTPKASSSASTVRVQRSQNFEGLYYHSTLLCDIKVVYVHGNSYNCHYSNGNHTVARYQQGHILTTESEKGVEYPDGSINWKGSNQSRFQWHKICGRYFHDSNHYFIEIVHIEGINYIAKWGNHKVKLTYENCKFNAPNGPGNIQFDGSILWKDSKWKRSYFNPISCYFDDVTKNGISVVSSGGNSYTASFYDGNILIFSYDGLVKSHDDEGNFINDGSIIWKSGRRWFNIVGQYTIRELSAHAIVTYVGDDKYHAILSNGTEREFTYINGLIQGDISGSFNSEGNIVWKDNSIWTRF